MTADAQVRTIAGRFVWVVVCGFLPLVALYYVIAPVLFGDRQVADFNTSYYYAADALRAGETFYSVESHYVYSPVIAVVSVPWTLMPVGVAESIFQFVLVAIFIGTLAMLGVRDWRCYGLAFLWPPVTDAVSTGNVTIVLGFAAALAWRFRDSARATGAIVGISIAAKFLFAPVVLWLVATRRVAATVWSLVVASAAVFGSWAVIGFSGLTEYLDLVRRLSNRLDEHSYTLYALGLDSGLSDSVARAVWLALAITLVASTLVLGRRGDDRRAFVLALSAALAISPLVHLHSFALLLVIVALVQPQIGPIWFIGLPLHIFVTTGNYNGTTAQTTAVLVAAAMTVALALRRAPAEKVRMPVSSPVASRP